MFPHKNVWSRKGKAECDLGWFPLPLQGHHVFRAHGTCVCLKEARALICDGKLQEPARKELLQSIALHRGVESTFCRLCLLFSFLS